MNKTEIKKRHQEYKYVTTEIERKVENYQS